MTYNSLTNEYEVFRLLKSSPELHQFYTSVNTAMYEVGNQVWPNRIKFPEQLLECIGKTIYLVELMEISSGAVNFRSFEDISVHLHVVEDVQVFKGKAGIVDETRREAVSFEEMSLIGTDKAGCDYFITSEIRKTVFQIDFLNLTPYISPWCGTYDAVFYDLDTASAYARALREFKKKKTP